MNEDKPKSSFNPADIYPTAKSYDEIVDKRSKLDTMRYAKTNSSGRDINYSSGVIINLFLIIPIIITYLSVTTILGWGVHEVASDAAKRINTILLAGLMMLVWVRAARYLIKSLGGYRISRLELLFMYLIFVIPSASIFVELNFHSTWLWLAFVAFAVVSQLYIWAVLKVFNSTEKGDGRKIPLFGLLACVWLGAIGLTLFG